jgi:hypothetical protein
MNDTETKDITAEDIAAKLSISTEDLNSYIKEAIETGKRNEKLPYEFYKQALKIGRSLYKQYRKGKLVWISSGIFVDKDGNKHPITKGLTYAKRNLQK